MKVLLSLCCFSLLSFSAFSEQVYKHSISGLADKKFDLSSYKGKPLLIVNIATRCGYTGQLRGLESLQKKYQAKGFSVIGVPSNDFGGQTPEESEEVAKICKLNYGVSFPLTAKTKVKGKEKHELYRFLTSNTGGAEVKWNFEKFLVNKEGKVVKRFRSSVKPMSSKLTHEIEKLL